MRETRQRHKALLRIIANEEVRTQEELVSALEGEGFRVSQASVSRDIAALGLTKLYGRYVRVEPPHSASDPLSAKIQRNVLSVQPAGDHLVVLDTPPGEASAVALTLDRLQLPGVVGTVAGDDTIFLAMESATASRKIMAQLNRMRAAGAGAPAGSS